MTDIKEDFLEADMPVPGQNYVCLSFISPENVLKKKDQFLFQKFVSGFSKSWKLDLFQQFMTQEAKYYNDAIEKAFTLVEDVSGGEASAPSPNKDELKMDVAKMFERFQAFVQEDKSRLDDKVLEEEYSVFMMKQGSDLERQFFEENEFQTSVRGLKVRGVYDTRKEAEVRAKVLQKRDRSFNVYVGQVGYWLPWDPEPSNIADQEYAERELNELMKKYKENESKKDEYYEEMKRNKLEQARKEREAATTSSSSVPTEMFEATENERITATAE